MDFKKIGEKVLFGLKWFFHSYIWLFVLGFVTDLVTKLVMVNYFKTHTDPIIIIGTKSNPFLQIDYVINNGIAFGFQTGNELANKIIFSIVSIVGAAAIIGLYVYNFKKSVPPPNAAMKTEQKLEAKHLALPGREAASRTC